MIDAVIVRVKCIAVPMRCEHFHRAKGGKSLNVEHSAEPLKTLRRVGNCGGCEQRVQILPALVGATVQLERLMNVHQVTFVKVAAGFGEVALEKSFVHRLNDDVKA